MSTATTDLFYSASAILPSSNDLSHRANIQNAKKSQRSIPRNQVFTDGIVDSFLISSTLSLSRQDATKLPSSSNKRYVSSFKTLVNATNLKQAQRLNYVNDSVMIFKLSKDSNTSTNSNFSSKHSTSTLSVTTSSAGTLAKTPQQGTRASPTLKIEGQKHRIVNHESTIIVPTQIDLTLPVQSMATSTTTQALLPPAATTNSTLFTYRSTAAGGNPVRQRAIAESTTSNLLISAEKFKTNVSTTNLRQARQTLTNSTALPSTLLPSTQRNLKSRIQQEKIVNTKDVYSYPDPFTNCPQEILNKLSQLTKLQLETIDWEKKKRFTKKKPLTNTLTQGKDSP